jgi:hypothetical protein
METMQGTHRPERIHPHRPDASAIDLLKGVVGIWLFISTAALGVGSHEAFPEEPAINSLLVGGALVWGGIQAALQTSATTETLVRPATRRYWSWFTLALAAWLLVSPWILGYSSETKLLWNSIACAAVLTILSLLNLSLSRHLGEDDHTGFVPHPEEPAQQAPPRAT